MYLGRLNNFASWNGAARDRRHNVFEGDTQEGTHIFLVGIKTFDVT